MQSIAPERSASISAWRSSSVRSGGFILKRESRLRTASSVSVRWCGVASQVIWIPSAFACSTAATDSSAERCWTWMRAVLEQRPARRRARSSSTRETDGIPASPSAAETSPSCIDAAGGELGVLLVQGDRQPDQPLVLERAAHHPGAADRQAVVGEADRARRRRARPSRSAPRRPCPLVTVAMKPIGTAACSRACSRSAATSAARVDRRVGVRHREDPAVAAGRRGARRPSRRPPCPRAPGCAGARAGRRRRGTAPGRRPRSPRRPRPRRCRARRARRSRRRGRRTSRVSSRPGADRPRGRRGPRPRRRLGLGPAPVELGDPPAHAGSPIGVGAGSSRSPRPRGSPPASSS